MTFGQIEPLGKVVTVKLEGTIPTKLQKSKIRLYFYGKIVTKNDAFTTICVAQMRRFGYTVFPHLLNTPLIEYSNLLNTEVVHGLGPCQK